MRITITIITLLMGLAGAFAAEEKPLKPNIILVLTDDNAWGELGQSGNKLIKTPNIDRLAEQSLRFTNYHVAPSCSPSRAELMSGKHEFFVGVTHTILGRENLRDDIEILPQIMKRGGYQTGMFGKWHLASEKTGLTGKSLAPYDRGFDTAIYTYNQLGRFDPKLNHNGEIKQHKGYCADVLFEQGMKWMESCDKDKPYFMYLATSIPHVPLAAPQRFIDLYAGSGLTKNQQVYYAMVSAADENVGKLMAWLGRQKSKRETILIFMTDNGHAIAGAPGAGHDHDGFLKEGGLFNAGFRGGKGQQWRGSTCVPFILRWPGVTKPNSTDNTLTSALDILPTFAEIAGVKLSDPELQGYSLLPNVLGKSTKVPSDRMLFTHVGRWESSDLMEQSQFKGASVLTSRYRLTWEKGVRKLYAYADDRGELTDVAAQHPEVVEELTKAQDKWWQEAKKGMVNDLEQIRTGKIRRQGKDNGAD
ncbi:MAG TPA: arylsulfatase [Sedimentisphaerales bacterium]|nr:arylsulfatase [Sedimentisphaerales bacterium]